MNIINKTKPSGIPETNNPEYFILHHTASASLSVDNLIKFHTDPPPKGRGWWWGAYHYYIRKDGTIYQLRKDKEEGAHCKYYNKKSIGVCLEGNFTRETPTEAQKSILSDLITELDRKYHFTKKGYHRDYRATECPGKKIPNSFLDSLGCSIRKFSIGEIIRELKRRLL